MTREEWDALTPDSQWNAYLAGILTLPDTFCKSAEISPESVVEYEREYRQAERENNFIKTLLYIPNYKEVGSPN